MPLLRITMVFYVFQENVEKVSKDLLRIFLKVIRINLDMADLDHSSLNLSTLIFILLLISYR